MPPFHYSSGECHGRRLIAILFDEYTQRKDEAGRLVQPRIPHDEDASSHRLQRPWRSFHLAQAHRLDREHVAQGSSAASGHLSRSGRRGSSPSHRARGDGHAHPRPQRLTEQERAEVALSDELVEEFLAADAVVIGAPMYNFSLPTPLKAWIDRIALPAAPSSIPKPA
jgi:hypothetical protein